MNPGKTQYKLVRKDGSSYISQEFDTLNEAIKESTDLLLKGNVESILINSKSSDESYLDAIKIKCHRMPRQQGLWHDLRQWWSN